MPDYLDKIRNYCAYQDRCHSEVKSKLIELSVYGHDLEEVISQLISEDFLNEERFARSFVRGKFKIKNWGKTKIIQHLKAKYISEYCIKKGLSEIDEEEYFAIFEKYFEKKKAELSSEKNIWIKKKKILNYLLQRGFESHLIYEKLKTL